MSIAADDAVGVDAGPRCRADWIKSTYEPVKALFEFALALVMLLLSVPVVVAALAVVHLTSKGPVIYTQRRLGRGGRTITIYKIRTMYQDSERGTGAVWSLPGDPRITPVGRFLRWAHLDELPQLVNVLRGEMSLVGPRPERPEIVATLELGLPRYRERLRVRPGLTGLAQVQLPPDSDLDSVRRKLELDLCYVEQMSLSLDLRVLLATVLYVVRVPGPTIARLFQLPAASPIGLGYDAVAAAIPTDSAWVSGLWLLFDQRSSRALPYQFVDWSGILGLLGVQKAGRSVSRAGSMLIPQPVEVVASGSSKQRGEGKSRSPAARRVTTDDASQFARFKRARPPPG
jgi:lipopolysaccharide/colanic/teichoic acid biosynthesis glycosyltransferase